MRFIANQGAGKAKMAEDIVIKGRQGLVVFFVIVALIRKLDLILLLRITKPTHYIIPLLLTNTIQKTFD